MNEGPPWRAFRVMCTLCSDCSGQIPHEHHHLQQNVLRFVETLQKAVGLPWITPHCFRHQRITLRVEAGESIKLVAKDVGHVSTQMTRYYTHRRPEKQQAAVAAIDSSARIAAAKKTA